MLRNVSNISTKVMVLSDTILPSPIGIAPTALQKMAHPLGEVATARGTVTYIIELIGSDDEQVGVALLIRLFVFLKVRH